MNRLILTILIIAAAASGRVLGQEIPDTVKVIGRAESVTVSRTGNTTTMTALIDTGDGKDLFSYEVSVDNDSYDDPGALDIEFPFSGLASERCRRVPAARRLRRSVIGLNHIYIGQRFNYFDKGNVKNSIEFGVRNIVGMKWNYGACRPAFSIGVGMSWQRYAAADGYVYGRDGASLVVNPVDDGVRRENTHLDVLTVQFPLMYTQPVGPDVSFMLGAVACLNTYADASAETSFGDVRYKTSYKGFQQRLFTAELVCALGVFNAVGMYASWSPMTLFGAPYGPELKSWSIGATFSF